MNSSISATELKMAIAVATITTVPLLALAVFTPGQGAQDAAAVFASDKTTESAFSFASAVPTVAQSTEDSATGSSADTGFDLAGDATGSSEVGTSTEAVAEESGMNSVSGSSVTKTKDEQSLEVETSDDSVDVDADFEDISVSIEHSGTLDGSSNESEVEIDRTVDTRERNSYDVDNDIDEDIDAGNDKIKNNEFVGTINPGTVRVDFDGLDD